jgi:hypothetical protein
MEREIRCETVRGLQLRPMMSPIGRHRGRRGIKHPFLTPSIASVGMF